MIHKEVKEVRMMTLFLKIENNNKVRNTKKNQIKILRLKSQITKTEIY